jgi:hypothetical protein
MTPENGRKRAAGAFWGRDAGVWGVHSKNAPTGRFWASAPEFWPGGIPLPKRGGSSAQKIGNRYLLEPARGVIPGGPRRTRRRTLIMTLLTANVSP